MPTFTTNYNLDKPVPGGDDDSWGASLNAALDKIDAALTALRVPVGGLYLSATDIDPATTLGYGTWTAHAAGRALVGVGSNGESTWAVGDENGSETHTLSWSELAVHSHADGTLVANSGGAHSHVGTTNSGGVHSHTYEVGGNSFGTTGTGTGSLNGGTFTNTTGTHGGHTHSFLTGTSGNHSHTISGATSDAGGGSAHNNIQPSIAVYVWRRTA